MNGSCVPVCGSCRSLLPGAVLEGPWDSSDQALVSIRLRRRRRLPLRGVASLAVAERRYLTSEEFEQEFGADEEAVRLLEVFARETGLEIVTRLPAAALFVLAGTVAQFNAAFNVQLKRFTLGDSVTFRGRVGSIYLPAGLAQVVRGVHGMDDRPAVQRALSGHSVGTPGSGATAAELGEYYRFPREYDGAGETVALLHFGQGITPEQIDYHFRATDSRSPEFLPPRLVFGGSNQTGGVGEPLLDSAIAGGLAPGARFLNCFSSASTAGVIHGFAETIHDRAHRPSVLSVSWGAVEATGTPQFYAAVNDQLRSAALLGITVCCSTGDYGSQAGQPEGRHVEFPASSPYVLACGGSEIRGEGTDRTEVVWRGEAGLATGGGVSRLLPGSRWHAHRTCRVLARRSSKQGAPVLARSGSRRRVLPDVCAHAGGFDVYLRGLDEPVTISGTSCVAPLWAALVARLNQGLGKRVGYLNPLLYRGGCRKLFVDVIEGDNGDFFARQGWDACTGLGSPNGEELLRFLRGGR